MAPPPAKKIRLTFLWADRAALEQDFSEGYSKSLVDWASAFYKRYGFELDVAPAPGKKQDAYGHVLAGDTDGYEPDMVTAEEYLKRYAEARRPVDKEIEETSNEWDKLALDDMHKGWAIRDELQSFGSLSPVEWPAQVAKIAALFRELQAIKAQREVVRLRWGEIHDALGLVIQQFEKESSFRDFDTPARLAIGDKIVRSVESRMRDQARGGDRAADDPSSIFSESRLKILFCRFRLSPVLQKAGKSSGTQPHGLTTGRVPANSVNGQYMFSGPFTFINVVRRERITLAHEMVHAAGRDHRPDFDRMKSIRELIAGIKLDRTGRLTLPSFFERVLGGYYDGPADDVINYNSIGKDPDKVELYDQKLMEDAFFVKAP